MGDCRHTALRRALHLSCMIDTGLLMSAGAISGWQSAHLQKAQEEELSPLEWTPAGENYWLHQSFFDLAFSFLS